MEGVADAWVFWVLAAAMMAVALAFVLPALSRRHALSTAPSRSAQNLVVHRHTLAELERDLAEGRLDDEQHRAARHDLERRLLDDLEREDAEPALIAPRSTRAIAIGLVVLLPLAAFGLYGHFGNPDAIAVRAGGASSLPGAAEPAAQRAQLERQIARSPRDGRALVLLARLDMDEDRFTQAAARYGQAVAVAPKVATDPAVWCEYADALGMAQGRSLAGKPTTLIERALALDAAHPRALEMAGSAAYERRDWAGAVRWWSQLLAQLPEGTPAHSELAVALDRARQRARFALPAEAPPVQDRPQALR